MGSEPNLPVKWSVIISTMLNFDTVGDGHEHWDSTPEQAFRILLNVVVEMCPSCAAYYGNRAATYMMLNKYDKALEDARTSVQIDPDFIKVGSAPCQESS